MNIHSHCVSNTAASWRSKFSAAAAAGDRSLSCYDRVLPVARLFGWRLIFLRSLLNLKQKLSRKGTILPAFWSPGIGRYRGSGVWQTASMLLPRTKAP